MRRIFVAGIMLLLLAVIGTAVAAAAQDNPRASGQQAVSWDSFRQVKADAEKHDNEGKYIEALQNYLEYVRQADGLGNQELVAWGKNNAAFMIIKRHKLDSSVDLEPARKLLEEGRAVAQATEDCKKCLQTNMEYVTLFLKK